MNYFSRPEISNSDLAEVYRHFYGGHNFWSMEGLRFGTLFDAIVTDRANIDFLNLKIGDEQYTSAEFELAERMYKSILSETNILGIIELSSFQVVMNNKIEIGNNLVLPCRCKYDGWIKNAGFGWDLKSTSAKTYNEFLTHINTFSYYRQRAFYMDISGAKKDLLIAVSKYTMKVFCVPITPESEIYKKGKAEYLGLCNKLIELAKVA